MANRRRPSLKRLYADLKAAPPNVASLEVSDTGFKATFWPPEGARVPQSSPTASAKLVPGTPFPDDGSPIDSSELTLNPINLYGGDN